ncbi:MAG: prolipoprotein diacylglyceryl transferase [Patescibacteria group bacterium]
MNFLHNFNPQPVAIALGAINIRWYGLLIAIALVACLVVAIYLGQKKKISAEDIYDLTFWVTIAGIIGARLYDVLVLERHYYQSNPWSIIKIWQGGLAIHGVIIGAILALFIWSRIKKKNFWHLIDLGVVVLPLGQAIGRWGNYFNQELFGRPSSGPLSIYIAPQNRPAEFASSGYFQPTFLYESLADLLLFIVLLCFYKKAKLKSGSILAIYLIGYGLIRFTTEFFRIDETLLIYGWKMPQIFSIALIVLGIILLLNRKRATS